jgi:hypothetical protein
MRVPAVKHAKEASVEVENVTVTGILHKIQQWARKACYNANIDSYASSPHQQPHNALVHTPVKNMLRKTAKQSRIPTRITRNI